MGRENSLDAFGVRALSRGASAPGILVEDAMCGAIANDSRANGFSWVVVHWRAQEARQGAEKHRDRTERFRRKVALMFDGSTQVATGAVEVVGRRAAWRELDKQFRSLAKRRAMNDHAELGLIREAIAVALWRELGMTSIREYLEHRMGYTPGVASERVRVAEALDAMPALDGALAAGELSFSAVKAITRIATRKTERAWLAACRGKVMRQIEELLAEREPGDRPESPRKPDLRLKNKWIKMPPHVDAILRQCRAQLEDAMGERLDEYEVIEAMGLAFLRGGSSGESGAASSGKSAASARAPNQIAISVCPSCKVARQDGAGLQIAISPATFERAACDAQWLGNVDGEHARAMQDVTPATRRVVFARDRNRCRVPGCRSARNLEVHHIVHRAHGGSHEPCNLVCLCGGHHAAHHDGTLIIRGTADALEVMRLDDEPVDTFHVEILEENTSESPVLCEAPDTHNDEEEDEQDDDDAQRNAAAALAAGAAIRADATLALKTLGFPKEVAARAVRDALEHDAPHDLEGLIKGALRRCRSS